MLRTSLRVFVSKVGVIGPGGLLPDFFRNEHSQGLQFVIRYAQDHIPCRGVADGIGRDDQLATAGGLIRGSPLIWLIVSSVM